MTLFTDNPFEKMMIQKPDYGKREKSPPELSSPRCAGCPYKAVSYTHLNLLQDLQSRNERMFLLTFLVVNMADTKRKLENDIFAAAGIAQKYNLSLIHI